VARVCAAMQFPSHGKDGVDWSGVVMAKVMGHLRLSEIALKISKELCQKMQPFAGRTLNE